MSRSPRLPARPPEDWDDTAQDALRTAFGQGALDRWLATGSEAVPVPTVLGTLLHHPELAARWLEFNNVLLRTPTLGARNRELMVLRVAWRTRAWYEWAQHVLLAPRCDITDADVDAIAHDSFAPGWTELERDLVTAADELLDARRIGDATWTRLAAVLDEQQLVELVFTVGGYLTLALAFNSFDLDLESGVEVDSVPRFPT